MTFEEFQATRKHCSNLNHDLMEAGLDPASFEPLNMAPGYLYCGSIYISEVTETWPEDARDSGKYHLLIENHEWITDDLESLERRLYDWAMSAGYGD